MVCRRGPRGLVWTFLQRISRSAADCRPRSPVRIFAELVATRILPGVAISILAGNVFYAWQARRLANRTGRRDVTAIPFGVNTPTIFAYISLIMLPVYQRTHDPWLTWQVGIFASFVSGLVQTAGAFCTDWMRRYVPRAALLCPLAGIAMAFLCLGFIFGVFQTPEVALLPAVMIMTVYASRLAASMAASGGAGGDGCGRDRGGCAEGNASLLAAGGATAHAAGSSSAARGEPVSIFAARRRLEVSVHHSSHERAGHAGIAANSGERQAGGRRLSDAAFPAGEWRGHPGCVFVWQPVSYHALFWTHGAQGERSARGIFDPERRGGDAGLHDRARPFRCCIGCRWRWWPW